MNCLECRELLQQRLDGDAALLSESAKSHLAACPTCRSLFASADVLLKGLAAKPAITIPASLTDRLVTFAVSDREKRRQRSQARWTAIIGLAASVLLMVVAAQVITRPGKTPDQAASLPPIAQNQPKEKETPAPMPIAPRAEEARQAVAGLTERLAEETREQARLLLSVATPPNLAAIDPIPNMDFDPIEPAAETLFETGRQVKEGFEPVTRTARQAFGFLAREFAVLDRPQQ
ncbi:MAG: hypothetical protein K2X38_16065 [Gemmataceae bacterium]|nr:hypothetical protein [Gemmataceae bacterium]